MKWIPINERMPESEEPVLVTVNMRFMGVITKNVLRAFHIPLNTVEHITDDEHYYYSEKDDKYYADEGWYECNQFEEKNWKVDGEVVAWMPLPEAYRRKQNEY